MILHIVNYFKLKFRCKWTDLTTIERSCLQCDKAKKLSWKKISANRHLKISNVMPLNT